MTSNGDHSSEKLILKCLFLSHNHELYHLLASLDEADF